MAAQDTGGPGVDDTRNPGADETGGAGGAWDQARTETRSAFAQQQHLAADSLGTVAQALHQAAQQLTRQNSGFAGRTVDGAATRVDRFAESLRGRDLDGLVGEVEAYARRRPELFIGATVATGFVIARILKSATRRRVGKHARDRDARVARDLDARIHRDRDAWVGAVGETAGYHGGFGGSAGPAETGGAIYSPATGFAAGGEGTDSGAAS